MRRGRCRLGGRGVGPRGQRASAPSTACTASWPCSRSRCSARRTRERWLPAMARVEKIGAFGLTEPARDPTPSDWNLSPPRRRRLRPQRSEEVDRQRHHRRLRDHLGPRGGRRRGRLRRREGHPGYAATVMTGKTALRAVWQAEITLTDCRVPAENELANCHSFKDVAVVLDRTRYTVAWQALGLATASYSWPWRTRCAVCSSGSRSPGSSSCRTSSRGCSPRSPRCS